MISRNYNDAGIQVLVLLEGAHRIGGVYMYFNMDIYIYIYHRRVITMALVKDNNRYYVIYDAIVIVDLTYENNVEKSVGKNVSYNSIVYTNTKT